MPSRRCSSPRTMRKGSAATPRTWRGGEPQTSDIRMVRFTPDASAPREQSRTVALPRFEQPWATSDANDMDNRRSLAAVLTRGYLVGRPRFSKRFLCSRRLLHQNFDLAM